jgi:hypothetical protein
MSEGNERFMDPGKAGKAGKAALNEEGAEVEGHRALRNEDMPGKAARTEDDDPEVEGHMFRKVGEAGRAYKKG